ncbi:MAG TPA: aminotransferase class I/II-fold pyridoxal phosphate-dependent enzyme [Candidatus Limnocylindria bacterium]|nr:aminotransferase class I/II-fold pyridoxal phosphate-dependent enzyme [Candidatus Limnocylindria bacterium]
MSATTSLTQMQLLGVASETNVAEGYPRFAPTPTQQAIVDRFPQLLADAVRTPYPALEARAHAAFFHALGQRSAPIGSGRILSFYSSTVATDVVGTALGLVAKRIALVNPIIDCIPALLRHRGLELVPVSESRLSGPDPIRDLEGIDAVMTANPNNPTGALLNATALRRLADACAARDIPLVIDACFRAFETRTQYDTYAVLEASGVRYVVIEDTGKLWPTGGIKLGFLTLSANLRLKVVEVAADILLTAPPFSAAVVEAFALDMAHGGLHALQARIAGNRAILGEELRGSPVAKVADGDSRVSVSRVELPRGISGTRLWGQLLRAGVHSVPCRPFYWARPSVGERYLRIALAREPEVVRRAARALLATLEVESAA